MREKECDAMSQKIPQHLNVMIYEMYEKYLDEGQPISKIGYLVNEELGSDYPESSLRGRYIRQKEIYETEVDDEEYNKRLTTLAKSRLTLKTERKILGKERTIIDTLAREVSEKSVVAQVMLEQWGKEPEHNLLVDREVDIHGSTIEHIYAFADVHWGYVCDLMGNKYDPDVAQLRIRKMFDTIIEEVERKGYKKIYVADLGDQIEGEALRISQLIRISEGMTLQARNYANVMIAEYKRLAKKLRGVEITLLQITDDNHSQLRLYSTQRNEMPENLSLMIGNEIKNMIDTAHEFGGLENLNIILGDEILLSFGGYNVVLVHGHQYGRKEDVLHSVEQRHRNRVHTFIAGHWHQFSIKYKDVKDSGQQVLVFLPAVVGDTDFSEQLFVSGLPGFAKISIDVTHKITNAKMYPLTLD